MAGEKLFLKKQPASTLTEALERWREGEEWFIQLELARLIIVDVVVVYRPFGVSIETVKVGGGKLRARKACTLRGTVSYYDYYYYYYYVDDDTNTRGSRVVGVYEDARGRVARPPPFCRHPSADKMAAARSPLHTIRKISQETNKLNWRLQQENV